MNFLLLFFSELKEETLTSPSYLLPPSSLTILPPPLNTDLPPQPLRNHVCMLSRSRSILRQRDLTFEDMAVVKEMAVEKELFYSLKGLYSYGDGLSDVEHILCEQGIHLYIHTMAANFYLSCRLIVHPTHQIPIMFFFFFC